MNVFNYFVRNRPKLTTADVEPGPRRYAPQMGIRRGGGCSLLPYPGAKWALVPSGDFTPDEVELFVLHMTRPQGRKGA